MSRPISKQDYLADLQARVGRNRQVLENVFLPLGQDERSWQPAPGEWSVDQCFQHLILSFEGYLPIVTEAIKKPEPFDSDGLFRRSWWARRLMGTLYDPQKTYKTKDQYVPEDTYYQDVLTRFLMQLDRLSAIIDQAADADLQVNAWYHKEFLIRFNLGDHLNAFVSHDELHMDQARRALEAYAQRARVIRV